MSFWAKKENTEHVDSIQKRVVELEVRLSTLENSSNKREKMVFTELTNSIEEQQQSNLKKFSAIEEQQQVTQEKVSTQNITLTDYKKLIEELQFKQNILEERIAVYDEKILNLKILTTRVEAFLDEAKNQNQIPLTSPVKTTPKVFVPAVTTNKQPSWVKNSAKAELEPSVKKTKEEVKEEMKDDNQ